MRIFNYKFSIFKRQKAVVRGVQLKIENCKLEIFRNRNGQSLIEVVIGLAIGSILIGASAFAISTMLQTNLASQKGQAATAFAQELLNKARVYGSASWQSLYGLTKASSTQYFLNASGTTYAVVKGKEGALDNDVTNGLVGEWKFDEDAGTTSTQTYDASGNGNNGTLTSGAARATSTCRIANCISFATGTGSYVNVPDASTLNFGTSSFTIAAWVNRTASGTNIILGKRVYPPGYIIYFTGTQLVLQVNDASPNAYVVGAYTDYNNWHHIAVVVNRSTNTAYYYLDGALQGTGTALNPATGSVNNSGYLGMGRDQSDGGSLFGGNLDDVRLYNRALSADEVRQLWNSNVFLRYFYVENTCRTNDASSSISGVAPCGGGSADDPSTQKVTAVTQWTTGQGAGFTSLSDYLTRWKNTIFRQTDWSGGGGATNPVTSPGSTFSSSSGANFSGGSIRIQGL